MSALLQQHIKPFERYFKRPGLKELCINRPGEVWLETIKGWEVREDTIFDLDRLNAFASALATTTGQRFDDQHPLLGTSIPGHGHRIQVVGGSLVDSGFALSIRVSKQKRYPLSSYKIRFSDDVTIRPDQAPPIERRRPPADKTLIRLAVEGWNLMLSGETGSGKTTLINELIHHIPAMERIIAIEDSKELLIEHPNQVRFLKSKSGTDIAKVTYAQIIDACMRLRPDRVLVGEISTDNVLAYLNLLNTGHKGGVCTIHANSARNAVDAMVLRAQAAGMGGSAEMIQRYATQFLEAIAHIRHNEHSGEYEVALELLKPLTVEAAA